MTAGSQRGSGAGERESIYLIEQDDDRLELLKSSEFDARFESLPAMADTAPVTAEMPQPDPHAEDHIEPQPVKIEPADPLNSTALAGQPAALDGALSWTLDMRRPRGKIHDAAYRAFVFQNLHHPL